MVDRGQQWNIFISVYLREGKEEDTFNRSLINTHIIVSINTHENLWDLFRFGFFFFWGTI